MLTDVPDDEALVVWNDLNICERFGWQYDYVRNLSAQEHGELMSFIDAKSKIAASNIRKG